MEGVAGSLAGDVFAAWGTIQGLPTLGVTAPVKPALPFAVCLSLCSPFAGRAPEGTWGLPAAGTSASPGDTAGGDSHALLCQRRGPQALPCFAGCCDRLPALTTRFSLGSGGGGGGGCRGAVADLPSSQDSSEHGQLCCGLGDSCISLRDPHHPCAH